MKRGERNTSFSSASDLSFFMFLVRRPKRVTPESSVSQNLIYLLASQHAFVFPCPFSPLSFTQCRRRLAATPRHTTKSPSGVATPPLSLQFFDCTNTCLLPSTPLHCLKHISFLYRDYYVSSAPRFHRANFNCTANHLVFCQFLFS